MNFGIRMSGNEAMFIGFIDKSVKSCLESKRPFRYLEVGAASGVTMNAVFSVAKHLSQGYIPIKIIGTDLIGGWSLDEKSIKSLFGDDISIIIDPKPQDISLTSCELWLSQDPRSTIAGISDCSIDLCFIDGCHGKNCVKDDFKAVSNKIRVGGFVIFHDVGVLEQGSDWQFHCCEYINVRDAVKEIGLFDNKDPGWEFVLENSGSRFSGGDGNNCAVFKKIK